MPTGGSPVAGSIAQPETRIRFFPNSTESMCPLRRFAAPLTVAEPSSASKLTPSPDITFSVTLSSIGTFILLLGRCFVAQDATLGCIDLHTGLMLAEAELDHRTAAAIQSETIRRLPRMGWTA